MNNYYSHKLFSNRLKKCYEIASPPVQRYLEAEIDFVLGKIKHQDRILELGCGYGRVLTRLLEKSNHVVGIDTSRESLELARAYVKNTIDLQLCELNAEELGFKADQFDVVLCIQNGISAIRVDPQKMLHEAIRVTRPAGIVLFSSYSDKFWDFRLEWFREQADKGLIGEIDETATGNGMIVCKDGFAATTFTEEDFIKLAALVQVSAHVYEINESSLFCEMHVLKN
jgi:ubiquinone/menaquinone biosynthesis C-methylase UbiE